STGRNLRGVGIESTALSGVSHEKTGCYHGDYAAAGPSVYGRGPNDRPPRIVQSHGITPTDETPPNTRHGVHATEYTEYTGYTELTPRVWGIPGKHSVAGLPRQACIAWRRDDGLVETRRERHEGRDGGRCQSAAHPARGRDQDLQGGRG